jgi:uncharacterized protein (TIGR03437 family)
MAHLTQSGKLRALFLLTILSSTSSAFAQSSPLTCTASAVPTPVRAEGVTERLGDILLQCSGGPGTVVSGNLSLFLPVNITNRIGSGSIAPEATLTVDTGAAPAAAFSGRVINQSILFETVQFTVPAGGAVSLRVSNLRANVSQLGAAAEQTVEALISANFAAVANSRVVVGRTMRGLLATVPAPGVPVSQSPLPAELSMANLFAAGTRFASARFTEGFPGAFMPKDATTETGTRIVVRYTDVPKGARLFVPDVVAGADAAVPTAGGDLGGTASGGQHEPGSGALLLTRVLFTDANGAGGTHAYTPGPPGSGTAAFGVAREVPVVNGAALVVYEVLESTAARRQSAQFPTFVGVAEPCELSFIRQTVSFGPVSTAPAAHASAPLPRFAAFEPPSDCPTLSDCEAGYFPKLDVQADGLALTATAGGTASRAGYIAIRNLGGGYMVWNVGVEYESGSGWLTLDPPAGLNNHSSRAFASARNLAPGTYRANVTIDAGPLAGGATLPVTLTVTAAAVAPPPATPPPVEPPAKPAVIVGAFTNAANFVPGPVAPGSLATIVGANLAGTEVKVAFDGLDAKVLFNSPSQINVQVPAALAGKSSAGMVVTVDGASSTPLAVTLAPAAPAVFGILNQDGSLNRPDNPAAAGSTVQIFLTGLGPAVTVGIHDRARLAPQYAGVAPGLEGVSQVNVAIPADLPAMTTSLVVCSGLSACSHPAEISLMR